MKYKNYAILAMCLAIAGYAAYRSQKTEDSSKVISADTSSAKLTSSYSDLMKLDSEDSIESFDTASSTIINMTGTSADINGSGAELKDDRITITKAGTYVLNGTFSGSVEVNCTGSGTVRVVLNGVSIIGTGSSAIIVYQADKTIITSAEGTDNTLSDTSEPSDDEEITASVFSHDDLVINGSGKLNITANQNDGITSNDALKIINANITVNAADDGIIGKDYLYAENSVLDISCTGDGLKSSNDTDENSGIALINGGEVSIEADDDGIQTVSAAVIMAGSVTITSGGGYQNASTIDNKMFIGEFHSGTMAEGVINRDEARPSQGAPENSDDRLSADDLQNSMTRPDMNSNSSDDQSSADSSASIQTPPDMSANEQNSDNRVSDPSIQTSTTADSEAKSKGITSDKMIEIDGGTVTVNSASDALNSAGNISVNDGTLNISAGDDGMHADDTLEISAGTVTLSESYEGLEATYINLIGGEIAITSSDDGINTSNKLRTTTSGTGGFDSDDGSYLKISGGNITVSADGDGIDINGSGTMTAGTVTVNGPTNSGNGALDCAGTFNFNGGTLYAGGASGMVVVPSDSSICYSLDIGVANSGTVTVKDSSGNTIASYVSGKMFQNVVIASDQYRNGEVYTVYENDTVLGTAAISESVTYVNASAQSQNMMDGRNQKNQGGMKPDGNSSDNSVSDAGGMQADSTSGATAEEGNLSS
ncbi:MAG: carbohydrate-binding domain-containing protein [Erysipelotrichia bacterium]|nr:carbohydrate-binding domain-containing protein [Erysipelotrichia bacterium]